MEIGVVYQRFGKNSIYSNGNNKINKDVITKICNLSEDHSISELINFCLAKNKNKPYIY